MNLMAPQETDRARAKTVNDLLQDMDARQDEKLQPIAAARGRDAAKCPCTGGQGGA